VVNILTHEGQQMKLCGEGNSECSLSFTDANQSADTKTSPANSVPTEISITMMEDTLNIENGHPHRDNRPIFTSAQDTFNFLHDLGSSNRSHVFNFNNGQTHMREECVDSEFRQLARKGTKMFECIPSQEGDFERRIFYGYDIFVGYANTRTNMGFICPSVIVNINENGGHEDSGKRLLMILRTRCINPEYHALIYSHMTGKIELLDKGNFFSKTSRYYTAWHLAFDFDNMING